MKRAFDVAIAALGLVVLTPVLAACAIAVKLSSEGPVLFRTERIGRLGSAFTLYKFRTMTSESGPGITKLGDKRITRVGRTLRKSKLDELPQLWNVLMGEMSLVGPRPEDPRYVANYTPEQRHVLSVRPGLTSPAAIKYRHEDALLDAIGGDVEVAYVAQVLPEKLEMDLQYVRTHTFVGDIRILIETATSIAKGK